MTKKEFLKIEANTPLAPALQDKPEAQEQLYKLYIELLDKISSDWRKHF